MDDDLRVNQSRRADDLLDDLSAGLFQFEFAGSGGDEDHLVPHLLEFLEFQRAIVHGAGKAEAVIDQHLLALAVAVVHRVDLRHGHMRFIDDQQEILGEIIDQRIRLFAGFAAVQMPAVVFDAAAIADLQDHLQIVFGAGEQPLGFEQFSLAAKVHDLHFKLIADGLDGAVDAFLRHDVVNGGIDEDLLLAAEDFAGERIDGVDRGDFIAEDFDPIGEFLVARDGVRSRRRGRGRWLA